MPANDGFIHQETIDKGLYVSTTNVWDLGIIHDMDVTKPEFKDLLVRLYQNINNICIALNQKDSALYPLAQFVTGKGYFSADPTDPNNVRAVFRATYNTGALAAGVNTIAHGLPIKPFATASRWQAVPLSGAATNTTTPVWYPINWAGAAGAYLNFIVDGTNIVIDNNTGVLFDKSVVVLEFLKD